MPVRALVLFAVLTIAGCAGSRTATDARPDLPEGFPNHTVAQIQDYLRPDADSLTAFTAKARLSVKSPAQSANLSATMRHRREDSLYVALSPGLGIEAARVLVTPDSFFVYDRIHKQLNYGSLEYAATVIPAPLAGDDIFRSLLGLMQPAPGVDWRLEADGAFYYLHSPDGRITYTIDPTVWRVVRYEARTATGDLLESRAYSDFDLVDGHFLPRRILLQRPLDDTTVSIYYRALTLNPPTLSFALHVSDTAERVLVDGRHGASTE